MEFTKQNIHQKVLQKTFYWINGESIAAMNGNDYIVVYNYIDITNEGDIDITNEGENTHENVMVYEPDENENNLPGKRVVA